MHLNYNTIRELEDRVDIVKKNRCCPGELSERDTAHEFQAMQLDLEMVRIKILFDISQTLEYIQATLR